METRITTLKTPDPMGLPDIVLTAQGGLAQAQLATAENVEYILRETGFAVRLNIMTSQVEYHHTSGSGRGRPAQAHMEMQVLDMCARLRIKNRECVREILGVLAQGDVYHPMEEWLIGLKWDGVDHIGALTDTVATDNSLWPSYLENWFVQVVEGVCGWRRERKQSLPYVLVLVGAQGVGKSYWLKSLGREWMKGEAELHLSSSSGKDHQIEVLKHPMAELAELDGVFRKADIAHLKAFISREHDAIRAPYERAALERPRMTVFCASVNDAEFLSDPSGSRRFWPVTVDGIDREALKGVSFTGVWAQAYAAWKSDPRFELTEEEDRQRMVTALKHHTQVSAEEETIREFYRRHHGHPKYPDVAMNRTEIMEMLYGRGHRWAPWVVSSAGKVLADIIGNHRTIDHKQRAWMFPYNEFATDVRTWPDKYHLEIVR